MFDLRKWLVSACFLAAVAHGELIQWKSAEGGNDHWYAAIVVSGGIDWQTAYASASACGGHLATITSPEENAFIFALVSNKPEIWIDPFGPGNAQGPWLGGFQPPDAPEPDGGWEWITGEPWVYTAWGWSEPNNVGDEDYLHLWGASGIDDTWNDKAGTALHLGYILEISAANAQVVHWTSGDCGADHQYVAVRVPSGIDWSSAGACTSAFGGHLATIAFAEENDVIYGLVSADPSIWIDPSGPGNAQGPWLGGFQPPDAPEPDGGWEWITGELWGYTNWGWGEPNNVGDEDYLHLWGASGIDDTWNDIAGTASRLGYVAEFDSCGVCVPAAPPSAASSIPDMGSGTTVRYLVFDPNSDASGRRQAIRVTFTHVPRPFEYAEGRVMWVGEPMDVSELAGTNDCTPPTFKLAELQCDPFFTDWTSYGTVRVKSTSFVPLGVYDVQAVDDTCALKNEDNYSEALSVRMSKWGDTVGVDNSASPQGIVDFNDISSVVDKFKNLPGAPAKSRTDVAPGMPDMIIDFVDIPALVDAFKGWVYPFAGPPVVNPCP